MLIVGKTGSGKSHLLKLLAEQDANAGAGFALFDPHGDLARSIRDLVPNARHADLIYLDPRDAASRWRFNPFRGIAPDAQSLAASGIVSVFKKLWKDDWGPRLEHLLRNVAFALLETDGATAADIPRLLLDKDYRKSVAHDLSNPIVRDFWSEEYAKYTSGLRAMTIAPLQNKIGALLTDPVLRRFFTEDGDQLDIRTIMDQSKILVVNLDKGQLGEDSATLLGSVLLSHIALAGLQRSAEPEQQRRDFIVFVDEFQLFTTQALSNMLAELRKYRVSMTLATQYLAAIDRDIANAVLGNVGTIVAFRLGAHDAAEMAREFGPALTVEDFTSLPQFNVYVRLLIDGQPSKPFSAVIPETIGP
jgi:DNA helicase HerA-like ATPase